MALSTASSPAQAQAQSRVGMTKEEKAAEMARRKEERKQVRLFHFHFFLCVGLIVVVPQRIAQLKEQKKNTAGAKA